MPASQENQLEFFHVTNQPAPRPHHETLGRFLFQVRHDHLILLGVGGLLGLTVVFAGGVERGKQLAHAEQALLARQGPPPSAGALSRSVDPAATEKAATLIPKASVAPSKLPGGIKTPVRVTSTEAPDARVSSAKAVPPTKATASTTGPRRSSRYAIQVVSFSRLQLAHQELVRLQASGERAFLVMREGRTIVYVGPFPSREHAGERLSQLKTRYQDCFMRTL